MKLDNGGAALHRVRREYEAHLMSGDVTDSGQSTGFGKRTVKSPSPKRLESVFDLEMKSAHLGVYLAPTRFLQKWSVSSGCAIHFDFVQHQEISVGFMVEQFKYKMAYKFRNVTDIFKMHKSIHEATGTTTYELFLTLSIPPLLFHILPGGDGDDYGSSAPTSQEKFSEFSPRSRTTMDPKRMIRIARRFIGNNPLKPESFFDGPLSGLQSVFDLAPDVGRWCDQCYVLHFAPGDDRDHQTFLRCLTQLTAYGLLPAGRTNICKRVTSSVERVENEPHPIMDVMQTSLPDTVKFKLLSLISHNVVSEYCVTEGLVKLLTDGNLFRYDTEVEIILDIILGGSTGRRERVWDLEEKLRSVSGKINPALIAERCKRMRALPINSRLIRKVVVTPSKVFYIGPQQELANRVIRNWKLYRENFLRVSFTDDDLGSLTGKDGPQHAAVFHRIRGALDEGLYVLNRRYDLLLWSNSQLRSQACWFFHQSGKHSAEALRRQMGNFKEIKNPALFAARMAQCFSATLATGKISGSDNIEVIPDIERVSYDKNGNEESYCFSDGVGKIGTLLANNTLTEFKKHVKSSKTSHPCAFQFRMAGSKGVLVVDPTIPPVSIQLRKSQIKFKSKHDALEIIRTSFFSPGYLNRQCISLLETLGIPKATFLGLVREMLESLDAMLTDPRRALDVVEKMSHEEGMAGSIIPAMLRAGMFKVEEPFLINLLRLIRAIELKGLKKKCRIFVPKSCLLLGVLDETGKLTERKIFLRITDPATQQPTVVMGRMFIMRSPCLHPGDIQVVEGVDVPELHHLLDVVAFSQNGPRPLPNMLSGGDLDGDTFLMCWDERLIPKKSAAPMSFKPTTNSTEFDGVITSKELREHYISCLRRNTLGLIANAHLARADDLGADHHICLQLAQLASDAVDFPKRGGDPILLPRYLKPERWPDFMEKHDKPSYKSKKVAGEIWRSIEDVKLELVVNVTPNPDFLVEGYQRYLDDARLWRDTYNAEMRGLMNQYQVGCELELVSGYMFKMEDGSYKKKPQELKEQVMDVVAGYQAHYRRQFWASRWDVELGAIAELRKMVDSGAVLPTRIKLPQAVKQKASAWYFAGYENTKKLPEALIQIHSDDKLQTSDKELLDLEMKEAESRRLKMIRDCDGNECPEIDAETRDNMMSFPWVVWDVLCNIFVNRKTQSELAATEQIQPRVNIGPSQKLKTDGLSVTEMLWEKERRMLQEAKDAAPAGGMAGVGVDIRKLLMNAKSNEGS
ncbi:RNA dependent RNA polymerase-domain-containing protein [Cladochytrium replicatum]|nr:RNA dependent RNA polymerase-domain-containing protein [Cladochytrium replicatum]